MSSFRSALGLSFDTWSPIEGELRRTDSADSPSAEDQATTHFRELGVPVQRYLMYACRDKSDAEDLTQEVFIRLYGMLCRGRRIENVRFWVFHVARNLMLDRGRQLAIRARRECHLSADLCDAVATPTPTPEEQLLAADDRRNLEAAIDELTDLQRQCVLLRAEGLKLREIAELLDMDVRRVAEAIERGVRNIRKVVRG